MTTEKTIWFNEPVNVKYSMIHIDSTCIPFDDAKKLPIENFVDDRAVMAVLTFNRDIERAIELLKAHNFNFLEVAEIMDEKFLFEVYGVNFEFEDDMEELASLWFGKTLKIIPKVMLPNITGSVREMSKGDDVYVI